MVTVLQTILRKEARIPGKKRISENIRELTVE
jgi:hypothetical protein